LDIFVKENPRWEELKTAVTQNKKYTVKLMKRSSGKRGVD
jgi:hypothetical protein